MRKIASMAVGILCAAVISVSVGADYNDELDSLISENSSSSYFSSITLKAGLPVMVKDSVEVQMRNTPVVINGTTYVSPIDLVSHYDADYEESGNVFFITQGSMKVSGEVGSDILWLEFSQNSMFNTAVRMQAECIRLGNVIYLPVRAIVENVFAGNVLWSDETQRILLTRDYQTKRLIVKVKGDASIIEAIPCAAKVSDNSGHWIIQFDNNTADYIVKQYDEFLSMQHGNIEYSDPDILIISA
ncbi:MAG: hypothetical protein IJH37_08505 [Clostridia bacterium]|nr:hypothetical protein [Clostridia bacterium]